MSQWSRSHPEESERISRLPISEQNEALKEAMLPIERECEVCFRPSLTQWCSRCMAEQDATQELA